MLDVLIDFTECIIKNESVTGPIAAIAKIQTETAGLYLISLTCTIFSHVILFPRYNTLFVATLVSASGQKRLIFSWGITPAWDPWLHDWKDHFDPNNSQCFFKKSLSCI